MARAPDLRPLERSAPWIAGVVTALPTLVAYYPPMTDLPCHEAVVGLLRHWGDEAWSPSGLYELNLGHTNQAFHLVAWLFSLAVGTRWAVKLVIAIAQLAIFDAGARFADHVGRSRWSALLLAPLALGFAFYWGFVTNVLGYAALLYALPLLDRTAGARPSLRGAVAACAALVAMFFAHGSVFVVATVALFVLAWARPHTLRSRAVALVPVALAALGWLAAGWRVARHVTGGEPVYQTYFFPFIERLRTLPDAFVGLDDTADQGVVMGFTLVAAALLFAWRRQEPSRELEPASALPRWRAVLIARRFEMLAAILLAAYLVAPYHYGGAMFVHERFLGPAWALFAISVAPSAHSRPSRLARAARVACAAVPAIVLAYAIPQFADADRTHRDLADLIDMLPKRSAATFVAIDRGGAQKGRAFDPSPAIARAVAVRGGRVGPSFTSSPICPVQMDEHYRWNEYTLRLSREGSRAIVPSHDLDRFGWVVVRTRSEHIAEAIVDAFRPDAELVARRGEWELFRSTHAVVGLESPDAPPPSKDASSIVARLLEVERLRRERARAQ